MQNLNTKLFNKYLKERKLLKVYNDTDLDIKFCKLFNHRLQVVWEEIDATEKAKSLYNKHVGLHVNCNKVECEKYHKEYQEILHNYINTVFNNNARKQSINKLMQFRLKNWYWENIVEKHNLF